MNFVDTAASAASPACSRFMTSHGLSCSTIQWGPVLSRRARTASAEHIRAAWSYINHADNAAKYARDEINAIKGRIKRAAKAHGVEISGD